jgi:lipopolysaccharide biosynthesis regulator YciM
VPWTGRYLVGRKRRKRRSQQRCEACGYDIRNLIRCPECGKHVES